MAAKRLVKRTSGKSAGQAKPRAVAKKARTKLSKLRSEAALRGWETRRKNERKAVREAKRLAAEKAAKKAAKKVVKKVTKKVAKKVTKKATPVKKVSKKVVKKPHKFLGSEQGAVRGIESRDDLQRHFDRHKRTDRRKSVERILNDYQQARIAERPALVLELRRLYKQRFAKQSKDRLLKYYSPADRGRYSAPAYSVSLIRQLLEADASYLLDEALGVLDTDRERAYAILRREVAADPFGTAKAADKRLRQLVTLQAFEPPADFVEADETIIIRRLLDAADMGNEDEVAHQCAAEYGMDLRTVYTLLHSPNGQDFL